jgi:threonine/homoserine/homoserine lactone efflux protein
MGSALWWFGLFISMTAFHRKFNLRALGCVHRISGALICGFGVLVLLSPLKQGLGIHF